MRQPGRPRNLFPSGGSAIFKQLVKLHEFLCFPIYFISFVAQCSAAAPNLSGTTVEHHHLLRGIGPLEGIPGQGCHFEKRLRELLRDAFTMRLQTRHQRQKLLLLF